MLLLFFSQAGYYLFFTIQQHRLKESIKEQLLTTIPESSLDVIDVDLNKSNIEWEEEGKEFYLHGQLYDVAAIKNVNGKTLIYCLNDKKEELLLKNLAKTVASGNGQPSNSKHGQHTVKFQLPDYIFFSENTAATNQVVRQKHFGYSVALISIVTDVNTPPPDLIF